MNMGSASCLVLPALLAQASAMSSGERALLWGSLGFLLIVCVILGVIVYRSKRGAKATPSADELRSRLAQVVTMWAMTAIVVLGLIILAITGYHSAVAGDVDARREFVETGKYIFAAVVPVVAGWVGTVMAFYFGKENFRAATESVSQIARQLTSQEKLGQTRVEEIGKAVAEISPLRLGSGETNETITLDKLEEKMKSKEPPFERLPILTATGAPLMVVHRSILNDFLLKQKEKEPDKKTADYNLAALVAAYPWLTEKSFVAVTPDASAADAKNKMAQNTGCADVFVTTDGTAATPMTRWITNVDLLQAAQV